LVADLWCEGALRFENAKSRLEHYYVKVGPDSDAGATAFTLRSGCCISGYSGGHHAKVGVRHKASFNPTLLLGDAQYLVWWDLAGFFAALLSVDALDYYFISRLYALGISLEEAPDMIVFVATALFISWLSGEQKRAKEHFPRVKGLQVSCRHLSFVKGLIGCRIGDAYGEPSRSAEGG
jgi:hypothetical protein